jgi:hypothetical protein
MGCPVNAPQAGLQWPIQQGVVDLDPDVDALFRMLHPTSVGQVRFRTDLPPASIHRGSFVPFNSQNTLWTSKAFWGLLLPVTTTMRVTDIWRSYWVQRVLWDMGEELLFVPPTADQVRNPHDFYKDFLEEQDLYLQVDRFMGVLQTWSSTHPELSERIHNLTGTLTQARFWGERDGQLAQAWIEDLHRVGYQFPSPRPPPTLGFSDGCHPSPFPARGKVALWVRAYSNPRHVQEFWQLVASLEIFLPLKHYTLVVVLDAESAEDTVFGNDILDRLPATHVYYEPPSPVYGSSGHSRQQWSTFWADNYTQEFDLVMIVDTDTLLVSPITTNTLFDPQGRPRVKAFVDQRPSTEFWSRVPANTHLWIGLPEVLRGMAYFPVVLRREDFAWVRRHIELVHGRSFNQVFEFIPKATFSQFNIILNVLYYTRMDAYAWSFQTMGDGSLPGQIKPWAYRQHVLNASNTRPQVSGAIHVNYLDTAMAERHDFVEEGYCDTRQVPDPELCPRSEDVGIRDALFQFDGALWTWDERAMKTQDEYWREVRSSGWNYSQAQRGLVSVFAGQ